MKFAEKFLNMMKLNDADDETEPFDEEYNEVTEEEGYDEEEMEDEEEEPHKPILSLRRKILQNHRKTMRTVRAE